MHTPTLLTLLFHVPLVFTASFACAQTGEIRSGAAASADWRADAPGVRRHIKPSDLPAPTMATDAEVSIASNAKVVKPPQGALPKVPDGFAVQVFASGFKQPRTLRVAPNGDVFLSESGTGRVLVFRASTGGAPAKPEVFAENLDRPYGIVFQPPSDPRYVYVAAANQVVRYPYRTGPPKPRVRLKWSSTTFRRSGTGRAIWLSPATASACSSRSARGPISGAACPT
jgi:glucose/arabinose dehydrogenase